MPNMNITVNITVTSGGIFVDADPVHVPKHHRDVPIRWRIRTRGWKFAKDGIVIRRNYLQFVARRRENSQVFHWRSRNSHKGERTYEYTINLTKGKNMLSRDPGIKNGGK